MRQKAILLSLFTASLLVLPAAALDIQVHVPPVSQNSGHGSSGAGDPCTQSNAIHEDGSHHHDATVPSRAQADKTAISEMHAFARNHFNAVNEHPKSFGAARHWAPDWELRWIEFGVSGHSVRVYHLTSRHDPAIRYLSVEDHGHGHSVTWQPIH